MSLHTEQQAIELQRQSWRLQSLGKLPEAAEAARQAVQLMEEIEVPACMDVANLLTDLAEIEHQLGNTSIALALAERARGIEDAFGPPFLDETVARINIRTLSLLGTMLRAKGEYSRSELHLKEALAVALCELKEPCDDVAVLQNELGLLRQHRGQFDAAERWFRSALASTAARHGEDGLACATLYQNIGALQHARGEFTLAEPPALRAWKITQHHLGSDDPRTMVTAVAYAAVLEGLRRYEESEHIYSVALPIFERAFGVRHPETAALLHNLAAVVEARGSRVHASILYRRALRIRESHERESLDVALTCNNLGRLLTESSELDQACALLERAVQIIERAGAAQYLASARRNLESARGVRGWRRALGA